MCEKNMENVIKRLQTEGVTCVVEKNGRLYLSQEKGVKPVLAWLCQDPNFLDGALAADKVVGKAAAMLFAYGKVAGLFCQVVSEPAKKVLEEAGICFSYAKLVPRIKNRAGDGLCPMEQLVIDVWDKKEAFGLLKDKVLGGK